MCRKSVILIVIRLVEFNVAANRTRDFYFLSVFYFILERLIPVLVCNIFHYKLNLLIRPY